MPAQENTQLGRAFAQIEQALRSEYVVGYQPTEFKLDGSFRLVEIRPHKSNLQVHSRRGYYAPLETAVKQPSDRTAIEQATAKERESPPQS